MRTDQEMLGLILQIAKKLQVDAVALSGSRTNQKIQTDEFQDYDVVYIVDDLDYLNYLRHRQHHSLEIHLLGHWGLYANPIGSQHQPVTF